MFTFSRSLLPFTISSLLLFFSLLPHLFLPRVSRFLSRTVCNQMTNFSTCSTSTVIRRISIGKVFTIEKVILKHLNVIMINSGQQLTFVKYFDPNIIRVLTKALSRSWKSLSCLPAGLPLFCLNLM